MTIEKLIEELESIRPAASTPELSELAYRQAVDDCVAIIRKHMEAKPGADRVRVTVNLLTKEANVFSEEFSVGDGDTVNLVFPEAALSQVEAKPQGDAGQKDTKALPWSLELLPSGLYEWDAEQRVLLNAACRLERQQDALTSQDSGGANG